jgi:hypothetical protein
VGAVARRRATPRRWRSRCTFDGAEESIQINGLGSLLDSGTLVVSCWFQLADLNDALYSWGDAADGGEVTMRSLSTTGVLRVTVRNDADSGDTEDVRGLVAVNDSTWRHLWAVWEQTQVSWWLDGVRDNPTNPVDALVKTTTTVDEFVFGARHRGASPYQTNLNGSLANVVIFTADPGAAVRNRMLARGRFADPRWADPQYWFPLGPGDTAPTVTDIIGSVAGTMINMAQGNLVAP